MADDKPLAKELFQNYLEAVEDGRHDDLVENFTEDVTYRHPLIDGEVHGREELKAFFDDRLTREGAEEIYHEIENWVIEDDKFTVMGRMTGARGEDWFISYGEIEDGKISLYTPGLTRGIWQDEQ